MTSPFKDITVPQNMGPNPPGKFNLNDPNLTFAQIVTALLPYIFGAAGIILLFMIITSGFQMMTSKGDPKVIQMAQGKLTTAIIGVFILFISFFVVQLILQFFGISTNIFA